MGDITGTDKDTKQVMAMYETMDMQRYNVDYRSTISLVASPMNAAFQPGGSTVYGGMQSNASRNSQKAWWKSNTYVSEEVKLDGITLSLPNIFPTDERDPTVRQTIVEQTINALNLAAKPPMEWKANVLTS